MSLLLLFVATPRAPIYAKWFEPEWVRTWLPPNTLLTQLAPPAAPTPFVQTSWPQGAAPSHLDVTWPTNLLSSTLGAIQAPFRSVDWVVPSAPVAALDTWTPSRLPGSLQAPFTPGDWSLNQPAAPSPLTWEQNLLGTALAPAAQAPFKPLDWPLLTSPDYRGISWVWNALVPNPPPTGPTPFFQSDWPPSRLASDVPISRLHRNYGPLFGTPTRPIDWTPRQFPLADTREIGSWQNLQLTLLAAAVGKPFAQLDWSQIWAAEDRRDPSSWQNERLTLLATAIGRPFTITDWPAPRPASTVYVPIIHRQSFGPTIFPGGDPFQLRDWSLLREPPRTRYGYAYRCLAIQPPFMQFAWPLPVVTPQPNRVLADWPSRLTTVLTVAVVNPVGKQDWSRTFQVVDRTDFTTWQNVMLTALATTAVLPVGKQDWSRAFGPINRTDFETWQNVLSTALATVHVKPVGQQDWSRPFPIIDRTDWDFLLSVNLLPISSPQTPFLTPLWVRTDQLSGAGRTDFETFQTWQNLILTLYAKPIGQQDWSRRVSVFDRTDFETWQNVLMTALATVHVKPVGQQDWSRTFTPIDRTDFETWQNLISTLLATIFSPVPPSGTTLEACSQPTGGATNESCAQPTSSPSGEACSPPTGSPGIEACNQPTTDKSLEACDPPITGPTGTC